MRADVMQTHSHEASWRLTPGQVPAREQLARELLPVVQRLKRQLVTLGAAYFTEPDPTAYVAAAQRIAELADVAVRRLRARTIGAEGDVLVRDLEREFMLLGIAARRVGPSSTLSAQVAELRRSYGAIRDLGSVLWEFEYIFEGNAMASGGSDV